MTELHHRRAGPARTNGVRALQQRGIAHQLFAYDPSLQSAEGVASALGVPVPQVYKTLVMQNDKNRPLLVMVPGNHEVQPRVLARSIGEKSVRMMPKVEAERVTGLQTGGIGALALTHAGLSVYVDRSILALEQVYVNAGRRGLNVCLAPPDLIAVTGARLVDTA